MLYVFDTVGKSKYHVGKDAQGFDMDLTTDKDPMVQVAGITEVKNNMYTPYYGKKSTVPHSYFSRVVKDSLSTFVVSDTLGIPADGYGEYVTSVVTDEEGNPETYEAEETTTGEKSTGNWNFETDGDGENWGGLIPIG